MESTRRGRKSGSWKVHLMEKQAKKRINDQWNSRGLYPYRP